MIAAFAKPRNNHAWLPSLLPFAWRVLKQQGDVGSVFLHTVSIKSGTYSHVSQHVASGPQHAVSLCRNLLARLHLQSGNAGVIWSPCRHASSGYKQKVGHGKDESDNSDSDHTSTEEVEVTDDSKGYSYTASRYASAAARRGPDLDARMKELCAALDCSADRAALILQQYPSLITVPEGTLKSRVDHIVQLLGGQKDRIQARIMTSARILSTASPTIDERWAKMQALFGSANSARLLQSTYRNVNFLHRDPAAIEEKLKHLVRLGFPLDTAASIVLRAPTSANLSLANIQAKLAQLEAMLAGSPWSAQELVAGCPQVLTRDVAVLLSKFSTLSQAASSDPGWARSWANLKASTIGGALLYSPDKLRRLQLVVDAGLQSERSMLVLLQMKEHAWPEFLAEHGLGADGGKPLRRQAGSRGGDCAGAVARGLRGRRRRVRAEQGDALGKEAA